MVRRRYNKLEGLKGEDGIWRGDKESLQKIAISYFKDLFSFKPSVGDYSMLPSFFPELGATKIATLTRDVSEDEIKAGIFGIGSLKAPGPDGLPTAFFQNQWEVCINDLIQFVKGSFRDGSFPCALNQTLITLVPKVPSPLEMTQLRPISLCNTVYKLVSKIIVQRLRVLLPEIISLTRSLSFLVDRFKIILWLRKRLSTSLK